jgi:hypothetical protein
MHRSQILLEEWQYEYLNDKARREGKSISQIVRELITERIETHHGETWEDDPFFDIIGMASGDGSPVGRDHDKYIYTTDWHERRDQEE